MSSNALRDLEEIIDGRDRDIAVLRQELDRLTKTNQKLEAHYQSELDRLALEMRAIDEKNRQRQRAGEFYLTMQKIILDNPMVQSEWDRFLMVIKLSLPEDMLATAERMGQDREVRA